MSRITLLDSTALANWPANQQPLLLDTRSTEAFRDGHLPGARHLDARLLTLPTTTPAAISQFQILLGWIIAQLGITSETPVVVYGATTEPVTARVAWALAYAGIQQVAVLNGGLAALNEPRLTRESDPQQPSHFTPVFEDQWLITADAIQAGLDRDNHLILDVRDRADFLGEKSAARRHGHLPGAHHWDTAQELDAAGRLKDPASLRSALQASGITPDRPILVYCGSGPRASRTFLALDQAGYTQVAVYPASWGEWGNRTDLPIETA